MFYVCMLNDEQTKWVGLRSTTEMECAEDLVDYFCDQYPNAYIDILNFDEYHSGVVVPV